MGNGKKKQRKPRRKNVKVTFTEAELKKFSRSRWTLFYEVTEQYLQSRLVCPLGAAGIECGSTSRRAITDSLFIADVELATAEALKTTTRTIPAIFHRVLLNLPVAEIEKQSLINLCGEAYKRRDLSPTKYFLPLRKGDKKKRRSLLIWQDGVELNISPKGIPAILHQHGWESRNNHKPHYEGQMAGVEII